MEIFKCDRCRRNFSNKFSYDRHISRDKKCPLITEDNQYQCDECMKLFKHKSSYSRHIKICKVKIPSKTKIVNNTNITDPKLNVNNNVGIDGDVKVVKFGSENLSYMTDDLFKQILGRGMRSVQEYIEHSNFHEDHPENHNIFIANLHDKYIVIYDGKKWYICDRDEKMEDIIYAKSDHLEVKFNELKEGMDPRDVLKFENFMKRRDDDDVMNKIKGELTLQFYNNRYLPQRQKRRMELEEERDLRQSVFGLNRKTSDVIDRVMNLLNNTDDTSKQAENMAAARKLLSTLS